ncbi:BCSC C-terminal domain-containing protein [Roseomonas aerophila]|uniref:BCSC C-terminal domain-containing protein n=1 Tax=Teichococcus aerophilus TaxID=1224513 RepID=A0ABR7RFW6_9PROT|nr:cellulose biosynthesis protein BcsC [Pseudoroseomonas aerophila]MBC9205460.1 BCSC C-terminal domain-containing protein [Pseudoroseomonas aerophila]
MTKGSQRRSATLLAPGTARAAIEGLNASHRPLVGAMLGVMILGGTAAAQAPAPSAAPALPPLAPPASRAPGAPIPPAAAPAAAAPAEENTALTTLLEQVEYWRAQNRPDMAMPAVERILAASPNNPNALVIAAELAGQLGRTSEAEGYLATLRRVAPNDSRIAGIERQRSFTDADRAALDEARSLSQAGRHADAVARYRVLFPNDADIPDNFRLEFYSSLANSSLTGFREATTALEDAIRRAPNDLRLRLALAQIQTYRDTTRYQGIATLKTLAANPQVATAARAAWRDALLWEGVNSELVGAIKAYLAVNPSDPQLVAKLRDAEAAYQVEALGLARMRGFELLDNPQEAEKQFASVLQQEPNEPTALGGLGIVRMQQGRLQEARVLRDRALAATPADRQNQIDDMFFGLGYAFLKAGDVAGAENIFQSTLARSPEDAGALAGMAVIRMRQGKVAEARAFRAQALEKAGTREREITSIVGGLETAAPRGNARAGGGLPPSVLARRALERGDLARADDLARRAGRGPAVEQLAAEVILGRVALQRDDLPTAEYRFRSALARRPRLPEALVGLYEVLQRQNRFAEAEALQQETGLQVPAGAATRQAYVLRDTASRSESSDEAAELLARAKTIDPRNPWVRLDLARVLRDQGREDLAAQEERELIALGGNDAAYAAALLALENERYDDVIARLEAIPNRVRSADANRLLTQGRQQQDIARLEQFARAQPRSDAVPRLVALAGRPDPSGTTAAGVVRALGRLRQEDAALQAARAAMAANPGASPDFRIQLAGALLGANRLQDARAMTQQLLAEGNVTEEQRRQIASLSAGAAVAQAYELNAQGDQEGALAELQPALQRAPDNVAVNLALARVYLASNRAADAQGIADAVLARNPGNLEALSVATDAALARRDWQRADALLQEGRSRYPADPAIMLMDARLARAQGDHRRALRSLESAGVRRYAQLQANGGGSAGTDANLLAAQLRSSGNENAGGAEISDTMASQIATELAAARKETVTWIQAGVGYRQRSGQGGLSRLSEVTAPVEASTPVPGIGGRVTARAETVALSAGSLGSDFNSQRSFGTNPLAAPGSTARPSSRATGVALNVAYAYGDVRADIGSTPLGFRMATAVGGVEYAPALTDKLRLRVAAERRAVDDSLLSYGGMRDSRTGTTWGNVARTGGRAQLEYMLTNNTVLYGGGSYASVDGRNVAGNTRFEVGGGLAWTLLRRPDEEFVLGVDTRYTSYDRNLRNFTLGQGGYFSPQSQFAAVLQGDWRKRYGDWRLRLGGALGWQTYREDASDVFPNDAALQASLVAAAAADPTITTRYASDSSNGLIGGVRAEAEYAITPQLRLTALGSYDRAGNWEQFTGLLRLRYAFEQPGPDLSTVAP